MSKNGLISVTPALNPSKSQHILKNTPVQYTEERRVINVMFAYSNSVITRTSKTTANWFTVLILILRAIFHASSAHKASRINRLLNNMSKNFTNPITLCYAVCAKNNSLNLPV
jgi:hypothetical protein